MGGWAAQPTTPQGMAGSWAFCYQGEGEQGALREVGPQKESGQEGVHGHRCECENKRCRRVHAHVDIEKLPQPQTKTDTQKYMPQMLTHRHRTHADTEPGTQLMFIRNWMHAQP